MAPISPFCPPTSMNVLGPWRLDDNHPFLLKTSAPFWSLFLSSLNAGAVIFRRRPFRAFIGSRNDSKSIADLYALVIFTRDLVFLTESPLSFAVLKNPLRTFPIPQRVSRPFPSRGLVWELLCPQFFSRLDDVHSPRNLFFKTSFL